MITGGGGHNNLVLKGSKVSSDPDAPDNKKRKMSALQIKMKPFF